jgi:type VI secretion system protein ImpK
MERISEVTRRCFDAIIELRRADPVALPPPEKLHRELRALVDDLRARAAEAGFQRDDADDVAYAVVALADEVVASRSDALAQHWAGHSLQLHYFRQAIAGEEFFRRLEVIRKEPLRRREVLQAYAVALLLGFQGHHRVRGGDAELLALVEEVHREVARGRDRDAELLSPRGERPDEGRPAVARSGPPRWIGAGAIAAVLLVYAGLHLSIGRTTGAVLERVVSVHESRGSR